MRSAWLGLVLAVACSGGADDRRPAMPAEGGSSNGGKGARPTTGGSSAAEAGAAGEGQPQGGSSSGEGGAGDGGKGIIYEIGGAPDQAPPGVCEPEMMLGAEQPQDAGVESVTLLAMTPDERTVVFTTGSEKTLLLHVADRTSAQDAFVNAGFTLPEGFEVESGVALSSDGRQLILVRWDQSGFGMLSRVARGDAFQGDADLNPFAKINAAKPMSGRSVGWPVLSSDSKTLYFLSYFGQGLVVQSERDENGVFDLGTEIDEFTLGGQEGAYKQLNGLSFDQRAIFFFDEETQHQMALFRSRPGAPFYDPMDLGERRGMAPNEGCTRLYSSVDGKLVVQARK